jgi:hypothetical protein
VRKIGILPGICRTFGAHLSLASCRRCMGSNHPKVLSGRSSVWCSQAPSNATASVSNRSLGSKRQWLPFVHRPRPKYGYRLDDRPTLEDDFPKYLAHLSRGERAQSASSGFIRSHTAHSHRHRHRHRWHSTTQGTNLLSMPRNSHRRHGQYLSTTVPNGCTQHWSRRGYVTWFSNVTS